jgi:hypothetical protein
MRHRVGKPSRPAIAGSAHVPVTVARLCVAKTLVDDLFGQLHVKVWVHAARIPVACLDRIGVLASRPGRRRAPLSPAGGSWCRREIAPHSFARPIKTTPGVRGLVGSPM